ncbi:MAG: contact-dependent growth inhibition system immunity protein [Acidobacteriota bacterium]
MTREPTRVDRATAKANDDFIDLRTLSGYRLSLLDPAGKHYHFAPAVSDVELGSAVVDVLAASRFMEPGEATALRANVEKLYEDWVAATISHHQYKNRRGLFRSMRSCSIERTGDVIRIIPSCHEKLEGWSGDGIALEDHVIVSSGQPAGEIGAALRLAFDRCIP